MGDIEEYSDHIMREFENKRNIDTDRLAGLVEEQQKCMRSVEEEETLKQCESTLQLYIELINIKHVLRKTWDLQMLDKSVLLRFGIRPVKGASEPIELADSTWEVYKDVALQTIIKCDKISKGLQQLTDRLDETLQVIQRSVCNKVKEFYKRDSVCLLLEMWFLCGEILRELKRSVASFFIKAKLLLIDYELECVQMCITGQNELEEHYQALAETTKYYKSFMKVLIRQLKDSEASSDQALFEDCLGIFLEIEGMYHSLNMNWLLAEKKLLKEHSFRNEPGYLMNQINQFVDNNVHDDMSCDGENTSISNPISTEDTFISTQEYSKHTPSSILTHLFTETDLSLDLEHTTISQELPSLLKAFNNAKQLEMEMGSLCPSPQALNLASTVSTPGFHGFTSHKSYPIPTTIVDILPIKNANDVDRNLEIGGLSGKTTSGNDTIKVHDFNISNIKLLENLKLKEEELKNKLGTTVSIRNFQHRQVHGFGIGILNNLYGIGAHK